MLRDKHLSRNNDKAERARAMDFIYKLSDCESMTL